MSTVNISVHRATAMRRIVAGVAIYCAELLTYRHATHVEKENNMIGYKVFTHDLRYPIQGGDGWNFFRDGHIALRIAGLWPDGRPSRLFVVEADDAVEEIIDVRPYVERLSDGFDARFRAELIDEQMSWREALGRPYRDESAVEAGLYVALERRGIIQWDLRRYENVRSTRDAWSAWSLADPWAARAARDTWDARSAWSAWDAWDARDAGAARSTRSAWAARSAWAEWDSRYTWDPWSALTLHYAARMGWVDHPYDLLTVGIRDAYRSGLAIAIPTGPNELGWAI